MNNNILKSDLRVLKEWIKENNKLIYNELLEAEKTGNDLKIYQDKIYPMFQQSCKKHLFPKNYSFTEEEKIIYLKNWIQYTSPEIFAEIISTEKTSPVLVETIYKNKIKPMFIQRIFSSFNMAFNDIIHASNGNSKMGAIILLSCYIDYLSSYNSVKEDETQRYLDFISEFLPQYNNWDFYSDLRCKIVHNYSEGGKYKFIHNVPEAHLKIDINDKKTIINLDNLMCELYHATLGLIKVLNDDELLFLNAVKRFKENPMLEVQVSRFECKSPL